MTYRWQGHFAGDPAAYRSAEEVEVWMNNRCPIKRLSAQLLEKGVKDKEFAQLEAKAFAEVDEAVKFALDSPFPKAEDAVLHVYSDKKVELPNV